MRNIMACGLVAALFAGAATGAPAAALDSRPAIAGGGEEDLTLRVNDAEVRPGGIAAAVIRTYQSRGVGSGQVCFVVNRSLAGDPDAGGPTFTYLAAQVFNPEGDVRTRLIVEPDEATVRFAAPEPTINSVDGPLAVIYFRVDGVLPDQEFEMAPMGDSFLIGADGEQIPLEVRPGRLRIAEPDDEFELSAAAEDTVPGEVALLSIQTSLLRLFSNGTFALRYDPSIASGPPTVRMDPRHGTITFDASASRPAQGLMIAQFASPQDNYNRVPGDVFEVLVPTRADIAPGTVSLVSPVPSLTNVVDANGRPIVLDFEAAALQFVPAP
jgi:hypothetical protein